MRTLVFLLLLLSIVSANAENIGLYSNKESGKVQFAANEIENVLKEKGIESASYSISELRKMKADQVNIVLIS